MSQTLQRPTAQDTSLSESSLATHELANIAKEAGIRRVHFLAWRDLDDPEAGGSELHAHFVASCWAAAGIDVTFRTSAVSGSDRAITRSGYKVIRRSGRYAVFPGAVLQGIRRGYRPGDALVEIWNGMPFLSPLWYRGPRVTFLHHVHAEMWGMVLPPALARAGNFMESRLAPRFYSNSRVVTLSESSRREIIDMLGLPSNHVSVIPPGIDARYAPGSCSKSPLVVAVGRLVPVKRFDMLIRALAAAKRSVPDLEAVVVGEGYERTALEALRAQLGANDWLQLPGHVGDDELVSWYQRAWLVASTSSREGWGMSLTEAAACGAPAVASAIAGHGDSVVDDESGVLVNCDTTNAAGAFAQELVRVLNNHALRKRLSKGALARAGWLTWDATARRTLEVLAEDAMGRSGAQACGSTAYKR